MIRTPWKKHCLYGPIASDSLDVGGGFKGYSEVRTFKTWGQMI